MPVAIKKMKSYPSYIMTLRPESNPMIPVKTSNEDHCLQNRFEHHLFPEFSFLIEFSVNSIKQQCNGSRRCFLI